MTTLMSATTRSKEWEGRTVGGRFPLRQWLGSSDHSAVFLTEHAGEKAAIKLVPVDSDSEAERHLKTWRRAAELSHPNLIRTFDYGTAQIDRHTYAYVVMEFAEEDLSQILPQRPLAAGEVAQMLPPLLGGLSSLHRQGLLHGRIKPSNILAAGDQLKLSTDQVLPAAAANSQNSRRDVYDAPETAAGLLTPASDLWSVGVTLYVAMTQKLPEEGSRGSVDSAPIPEPFRAMVRSCLQLDPRQRGSVADILTRLDPEASGRDRKPVPQREPQNGAPDETREEPQRERWRGNRIVMSLFILITAVAIAFVVFLSERRSQPVPAEKNDQPQSSNASTPPATPPVLSAQPKVAANQNPAGSVVRQVLPDLSPAAKNTIRGKIRIVARVEVDATGKVTNARLTTAGPSRYFARQTLEAARQWQFSPPVVNSQSAPSIWSITFRISRKQTQTSPERLKH